MPKRNCELCKAEFTTTSDRVRKGWGRFCSHACYIRHRWHATGKCKACGRKAKLRFCSDRCRMNFWNRHARSDVAVRHWVNKLKLIASLGGKCVGCGIDDVRVLDINHLDPRQKKKPKDRRYSWSRRFLDWAANAGNLELRCSNCHRLHTWKQQQWGKVLDQARAKLAASTK